MKPIRDLLGRVRSRLLRDHALTWAANGAAAAAVLALAAEVAFRRWPLDPAWPAIAGAAGVGLAVAVAGWALAWPSWAEVARLADARLGGSERLTTALQFATEGGWLYTRQREDAAEFAQGADLGALGPLSPPFKVLAVAAGAGVVALVLALLPNPALQDLRQRRIEAAAQTQAAQQVQQISQQLAQGQPGENPSQRQALTKELQQAASSVKSAPNAQSAVAALSQAQASLRQLQDPSQGQKQDAAQGAGAQLAQNASAAKAGQALAGGDTKTGSTELNNLAQNLPNLSAQQQQQLAQSLAQAANAASGDQQLQSSLNQAAQALQQGNVQAAQQALQAAAQETQSTGAQSSFQGDVNQAVNGLQQAKQPLENAASGQQGQQGQSGQQGQQGTQDQSGQQGQGQGQTQGPGAGQGQGQGQGAGQGQGQGQQGQGQGSGQGQGQGGQGQGGNGNGGGTGGSGKAASPNSEPIYVTGQSQDTGQGQNQGNQPGVQNGLVPYQQVLSNYSASALNQTDRADIPQQEQQLVQQYFSGLGGQ